MADFKSHYPDLGLDSAALKASPLAYKVTKLALSNVKFKDILIHEGRPLKINAPGGFRVAEQLSDPITGETIMEEALVPAKKEIEELLTLLDKDWQERIKNRAIDEGRSFGGRDRLRLNFFIEGDGGLAAVIRRFPATPPRLDALKAPDALVNMLTRRSGLILAVGQASHGKSTTCAALLDEISRNWATHIVTVENPIEFKHEDQRATFSQRQVGSLGLISTAAGVEDAMRQSPGVIYVAEIKDTDTANAVFYALESGHLVIATSHARSAIDGLQRLLSFFPNERGAKCGSLASNLIGVVHQALVPVVDPASPIADSGERERIDFQAFFEVLPNSEHVAKLIEGDKFADLTKQISLLDEGQATTDLKGVQVLNKALADAVKRGILLHVDALSATMNPSNLSKRISSKS